MAASRPSSDSPQFSEVSRWGIVAIACGTLAVFSANIAGFIPASAVSGLHATRLQAASYNQVRTQVLDLRQENARLKSDYRALQARFNLMGDDSGEMIRRLSAVEKSLPLLIESLPLTSDIDRSLLTASIISVGGEVYEAEGGKIAIRYSPLFDGLDADATPNQPMPPPLPGITP